MTDLEIGSISQLNWLWLVAAAAFVGVLAIGRNRRSAMLFASREALRRLLPGFSLRRQAVSLLLVTASLAVLVLAMIDVRWGKVEREIPQSGIEVMFLLDVSKSMLAEDVSPSRLDRAKQMIKDTVDEMAGDRIGLTIFSGEARQRIPLTNHYDDFKQALDEVTTDELNLGGSSIGYALGQAAKGFFQKSDRQKAVVLISDGEDLGSEPLEVAKTIHDEFGIRIFAIGIGDATEGARIPTEQNGVPTYLEYRGQQVWSKLDGEVLEQIASITDGAYIPAGTKRVSMADFYAGYLGTMQRSEFETTRVNAYEARYQWFCGFALMLLTGEIVIRTNAKRVRAT